MKLAIKNARGVVKSVDVQAKKIVLDGEILKQICV